MVAEQHQAEGADPVGEDWHGQGEHHHGHPPPGRAVHHEGVECAEGQCGDDEAQPRARLGHVEAAGGDLDQQVVHVVGDAGEVQAPIDHPRRDHLQRGDGEGAEGDEEDEVDQGCCHGERDAPAEHREGEGVEQAQRAELPTLHDPHALGDEPEQAGGDGEQREERRGLRGEAREAVLAHPGQPNGDGQDQPAMVVGGRRLPDMDGVRRFLAEQPQPAEDTDAEGKERQAPRRAGGGERAGLADARRRRLVNRPLACRGVHRCPVQSRGGAPIPEGRRCHHHGSRCGGCLRPETV